MGPFKEMSRTEQKAQMSDLLRSGMDLSDRGEHRKALKAGRSGIMISFMLGEAPSTLLAFTVVSTGHVGLRDFKKAAEMGRRAVAIVAPYFPYARRGVLCDSVVLI